MDVRVALETTTASVPVMLWYDALIVALPAARGVTLPLVPPESETAATPPALDDHVARSVRSSVVLSL